MSMKYLAFILIITSFLSCQKGSGDSTTRNGKLVVYNKGVPGNVSAQLVERIDEDVLNYKPQLVVIMIGTNDVSHRVPYDQYTANITTLVTKIQAQSGKVLLLSPPPRGTAEITTPTYFMNDRNDKINLILDSLSQSLKCYYLDINAAFKNAGSPNSTAGSYILNSANSPDRPDGVHLTLDGTAFLAKEVAKFIKDNKLDNISLVICFGDSLTAGNSGGYPQLLQKLLN
ncbi:SGNH/GDSL hydrolase family protein [Mucilaginibacter celer]|uniref:SGNH/GDSL hydrolase family protein n=1 Tax=Mucilaginibacter celer TaxID=2305508 RepID=A0A494VSZ4_9SPHI|nr:SGNH/GDSL hydrolase family protein [Mucilaginibacter celer]AYL94062.1 SGNH/GDSL hydrolase family protein [Mucilaginibacter celer]